MTVSSLCVKEFFARFILPKNGRIIRFFARRCLGKASASSSGGRCCGIPWKIGSKCGIRRTIRSPHRLTLRYYVMQQVATVFIGIAPTSECMITRAAGRTTLYIAQRTDSTRLPLSWIRSILLKRDGSKWFCLILPGSGTFDFSRRTVCVGASLARWRESARLGIGIACLWMRNAGAGCFIIKMNLCLVRSTWQRARISNTGLTAEKSLLPVPTTRPKRNCMEWWDFTIVDGGSVFWKCLRSLNAG